MGTYPTIIYMAYSHLYYNTGSTAVGSLWVSVFSCDNIVLLTESPCFPIVFCASSLSVSSSSSSSSFFFGCLCVCVCVCVCVF